LLKVLSNNINESSCLFIFFLFAKLKSTTLIKKYNVAFRPRVFDNHSELYYIPWLSEIDPTWQYNGNIQISKNYSCCVFHLNIDAKEIDVLFYSTFDNSALLFLMYLY